MIIQCQSCSRKFIVKDKDIPEEFSLRKKIAAQYGSRIDNALGKLTKKNKFNTYFMSHYWMTKFSLRFSAMS